MKKSISLLLSLIMLLSITAGIDLSAYAAGDYPITLTVKYGQTEARGMASKINSFRRSSDAWYWNEDNKSKTTLRDLKNLQYDYRLEKIAMQRAAEIAVNFDHTRPDGTICWTAYNEFGNIYSAAGENIAAGYLTADSVFDAWKEDYEYYDGQGHRRNMLNSDYTSVGIGHCVYNGRHYWVQEFGQGYSNDAATSANNSDTNVTVRTSANSRPAKVTGLHTAARGGTGERLQLAWDAQSYADGYNVYQKISGKYVLVATTTNNYYVFENLVPGWEYYFRVTAYKGNPSYAGYGSDEFHTCAACPPMDAPAVSLAGSNSIKVDWNIVNSHGYVIQWSKDASFKTDLNSLYVTGHNWDSYTINTKDAASKYFVRIRAWRNFEGSLVYGVWSKGAQLDPDALYPVTGLATTGRGDGGYKLRIGWDAQQGADSYNIYSYSKTNGWAKAASTADNYYVFDNVVPGWEYYYKVAAVKNGVEGPLSEQLHTCAACPTMNKPSLYLYSNEMILIEWDVCNSHGYVVQWSTSSDFSRNVQSKYVTGHDESDYLIENLSKNTRYYIRTRAWRNFEGGMVYGEWTSPIAVTTDSGCTHNAGYDHSQPTGNICRWFDSEEALDEYVQDYANQLWNQYQNGQITYEEYDEMLPDEYEYWYCEWCGKYTGSFVFNS